MATGRGGAGRGAAGHPGTGGLRLSEACTWCGAEVEPGDGFRAYLISAATNTAAGSTGERRAVFCRLEHLVPWAMQGAQWDSADVVGERLRHQTGCSSASPAEHPRIDRCSQCDAALSDVHVLLVRHRGEHRVADAFCSVDHLEQWAKAGGRWQ